MKPLDSAQLLIFDLDGTLVDSRADLAAGVNHMRSCYGLDPLPLATVTSFIGDGVRKLVERALSGTNINVDDALEINKAYYRSNLIVHTQTYPGVYEGIRQLVGAGHKVSVLTNKPGEPSRKIIRHFKLDPYVSTVIGGGDIDRLKPSPDGIHEIIRRLGMDSSQCWMIGDHHTDLLAAKNAGVRSAHALYGFGDRQDQSANASFASFSDLVNYFK